MLAKLLALLLQSKSAALSAVFVIGTTGALVSATTQNGVTTITVTQTSSPTATPTRTPRPTPTTTVAAPAAAPRDSTTGTGAASDCADQAHSRSDAVRTVNTTFAQDHTALVKLAAKKGDAARQTAAKADELLKQIREAAVIAIQATNTCVEDEDKNESADEDKSASADEDNDERGDQEEDGDKRAGGAAGATTSTATFTGTDPKAIADQAVAAMTLAFNTAKAAIDALPATAPRTRTPEPRASEHKGSDRGHGDDDD